VLDRVGALDLHGSRDHLRECVALVVEVAPDEPLFIRFGLDQPHGRRDALGERCLARLAPLLQRPSLHLEQRPRSVRTLGLHLHLMHVQRREIVERIALREPDVGRPAHRGSPRRAPAPERLAGMALQPPFLRRVAVLSEVEGHHLLGRQDPEKLGVLTKFDVVIRRRGRGRAEPVGDRLREVGQGSARLAVERLQDARLVQHDPAEDRPQRLEVMQPLIVGHDHAIGGEHVIGRGEVAHFAARADRLRLPDRLLADRKRGEQEHRLARGLADGVRPREFHARLAGAGVREDRRSPSREGEIGDGPLPREQWPVGQRGEPCGGRWLGSQLAGHELRVVHPFLLIGYGPTIHHRG
jgi:hypothetical protein